MRVTSFPGRRAYCTLQHQLNDDNALKLADVKILHRKLCDARTTFGARGSDHKMVLSVSKAVTCFQCQALLFNVGFSCPDLRRIA